MCVWGSAPRALHRRSIARCRPQDRSGLVPNCGLKWARAARILSDADPGDEADFKGAHSPRPATDPQHRFRRQPLCRKRQFSSISEPRGSVPGRNFQRPPLRTSEPQLCEAPKGADPRHVSRPCPCGSTSTRTGRTRTPSSASSSSRAGSTVWRGTLGGCGGVSHWGGLCRCEGPPLSDSQCGAVSPGCTQHSGQAPGKYPPDTPKHSW